MCLSPSKLTQPMIWTAKHKSITAESNNDVIDMTNSSNIRIRKGCYRKKMRSKIKLSLLKRSSRKKEHFIENLTHMAGTLEKVLLSQINCLQEYLKLIQDSDMLDFRLREIALGIKKHKEMVVI